MSRSPSSDRRAFLQQAAGVTTGLTGLAQPAASQQQPPGTALLPTIALVRHQVTRLILGGNPVYGHSHFNHLLSRHLTEWHTPERVVELLRQSEQAGINTWQ